MEEHIDSVDAVDAKSPRDLNLFKAVEQPDNFALNIYFHGARAFVNEVDKLEIPDFDSAFSIEVIDGEVYMCCTLPEGFGTFTRGTMTIASLGRMCIVCAEFEIPDVVC